MMAKGIKYYVKRIKDLKEKCTQNQHIHTWNKYDKGKLCCSVCDMTHNQYLKQNKGAD